MNDTTIPCCPYCKQSLAKFPDRKKKCEHCNNFIYVKTKPGTKEKILITEEQIPIIEKEWEEFKIAPIRTRNMDPTFCRNSLLQYKSMENEGFRVRVKILASGGEGSCENCKKQDGMEFSVDDALRLMPLPHKECTHQYGCRCVYTAQRIK